jgi:hypothetical protein
MALLQSIARWLASPKTGPRPELGQRRFRPGLEGMEDRLVPSSLPLSAAGTPVLTGEWFVQSDGMTATITQSGSQLTLTNEYGQQTVGQWLSGTTLQAWGQTAQVVQTGPFTEILWNGNAWSQSTWQNGGLVGQWFVQSNGGTAGISQSGGQLTLTNEQGQQTTGQWLSPTSFTAWGQTAQIMQSGPVTQILWNGNVWSQSSWQNGGLTGSWFVQSNGRLASIMSGGGQLLLTNEQGQQTLGQWVSATSFTAWGQTAQVVQNGPVTQVLWDGNVWSQSTWQNGGLAGPWYLQSDGGAGSITQSGTQLTLTNDKGQQTTGQWLSPTSFLAGGQTAQIVQNGSAITEILWNGDVWSRSSWQTGGLSGQWFVQSDGGPAGIGQSGTLLSLTNEQGQQTLGQWLSPTSFTAWGQTAQIVQNGAVTQIVWNGNVWSQSTWQVSGLTGQWFVQSNGRAAGVVQGGTQLTLTNEHGQQTTGQWISPTSFEAWGQTAQVVQSGPITQILWNGNAWIQSAWQNGGLAGQWVVKSNGRVASIAQNGSQLVLTNEQGQQTLGQWLSPTSFTAWGQTAQVTLNGSVPQIVWPGNVWSQVTVTGGAPTSSVAPLPVVEGASTFTVAWAGADNTGGSGIVSYAVYVSDNGAPYKLLQQSSGPGSVSVTGTPGHTYSFFSIATDHAGNVQPLPMSAQAGTTVRLGTALAMTSSAAGSALSYGQAVTFTAALAVSDPAANVAAMAGELLTFMDGGKALGTAALDANGVASFTPSAALPAGKHAITAVYNGDTINQGSSVTLQGGLTVGRTGTTLSLGTSAANNASVYGQAVTFTATVAAVAPGSGIAETVGENVTFQDGATILGTGTLDANGVATFTTGAAPLPIGTRMISAAFAGDGDFIGSSSTLTGGQTVGQAGTTTSVTTAVNYPWQYGQAVTFTATVAVAAPGSGVATVAGEKVAFQDGTTTLGYGVLNASGVASFTTAATQLAPGNHTVVAVYNGDRRFTGSSSTVPATLTVIPASTAIKLAASPGPASTYGRVVTFTATVLVSSPAVKLATVAGEQITFQDGSTTLGQGTLNARGVATFTTTATELGVGNHAITASYGGDSRFVGSSGTLAGGQTVHAAGTTTRLISSSPRARSMYGQAVTFTATVKATNPGAGTPTGPVSFYAGSLFLGRANLNNGVAVFAPSTLLPVGADNIRAVYDDATDGGAIMNATFRSSVGSLVQTVKPVPAASAPSQVTVSKAGSLPASGKAYTSAEVVTLTAGPGSGVTGPIYLEVIGLPSGVSLYNASGSTAAGVPYIQATSGNLAPGTGVSVILEFLDPTNTPVSYSTQIVTGAAPS